jgi:N-glycosylase/DNA lyase
VGKTSKPKVSRLPVTIDKIKEVHAERRIEIRARLKEFAEIWRTASDERLWEEMVFCFFTGGCSAKMGLRSIEAVKPLLMSGTQAELEQALLRKHRYPKARARYIVENREFLLKNYGMQIRRLLSRFCDPLERRDWLVKNIKGFGYKEASHFLRNIGFRGYAILDKHVLRCLAELKIIEDESPLKSRKKYLETEQKLRSFCDYLRIDFDEMDFVLWSIKTGEILK